jgi:redox-sensitive bicupin YhaK (pirin superfamily)
VNAATLELKKDGSTSIPLPSAHNAFIYLLDGQLRVDGFGLVDGLNAVLFYNDGDGITFQAVEDTRVLLVIRKAVE